MGPCLPLWILKGAKHKNHYISFNFWAPYSTAWSGLLMNCNIFHTRGSDFHTLTKNKDLSAFHRGVRDLEKCYLCQFVKFSDFQESRNGHGKTTKIIWFLGNVFSMLIFSRNKMKMVLFILCIKSANKSVFSAEINLGLQSSIFSTENVLWNINV